MGKVDVYKTMMDLQKMKMVFNFFWNKNGKVGNKLENWR